MLQCVLKEARHHGSISLTPDFAFKIVVPVGNTFPARSKIKSSLLYIALCCRHSLYINECIYMCIIRVLQKETQEVSSLDFILWLQVYQKFNNKRNERNVKEMSQAVEVPARLLRREFG